ncbi:putative eka-like protein, partial [Erysiphe neolycopersici]
LSPLTVRINELSTTVENVINTTISPSTNVQQTHVGNTQQPTIHNASSTANRKRRKFPSWDGDKTTFNSYIRELEDCIEIDREMMESNRAVWYDINQSLPSKAKQKIAIYYARGESVGWDFRLLIEHLKRTFSNKKEKEDKQDLLTRLKQKENQRFSDFFPLFDEALAGSGGEKWTEDSKLLWLRKSLSESLKDQLFTMDLDPDDYYGSVKRIEGVAYRFEQSRQFKGTKCPFQSLDLPHQNNTETPQPTFDNDGDVIMNRFNSNDRTSSGGKLHHGDQKNKANNFGNPKHKRAIYVNQTELEYRKSNKLCVRCGASAHFVSKCPYLPPKRPETSIKSTDIKIPPMVEEDYKDENFSGEAGKD